MTLPPAPPSPPGPRWVLHPVLIAAAFVLDVALANQVEPPGFVRSLAVAVIAAAALTLLTWGLVRDRWLGGLIATLLILAGISLRPLGAVWVAGSTVFGPNGAMVLLGAALVLALAVPAYCLIRARRQSPPIPGPATSVLNRLRPCWWWWWWSSTQVPTCRGPWRT